MSLVVENLFALVYVKLFVHEAMLDVSGLDVSRLEFVHIVYMALLYSRAVIRVAEYPTLRLSSCTNGINMFWDNSAH